jgi:hypothetical protein
MAFSISSTLDMVIASSCWSHTSNLSVRSYSYFLAGDPAGHSHSGIAGAIARLARRPREHLNGARHRRLGFQRMRLTALGRFDFGVLKSGWGSVSPCAYGCR